MVPFRLHFSTLEDNSNFLSFLSQDIDLFSDND